MLASVLEEVAEEKDDLEIIKVNTDDFFNLAKEYKILSIPTLKLSSNGKIIAETEVFYFIRTLDLINNIMYYNYPKKRYYMKTVEEVEEEYEEYEIKSEFVTNLEEFQLFVEICIADAEEYIADTLKEIKLNNKSKLEIAIKNFFLSFFGMEMEEFYNEDNDILREVTTYIASYREFLERILELADESNFKELLKLVDFSTEYYNQQISYYESQRDALEYSVQGISFFNSKYSDEREGFQKFIDKKLSLYNPTKSVEKIKKI